MSHSTNPDSHYLEVWAISKQFGAFNALDEISFEVARGEMVCLLGPSGCGKTTALRIVAGLENHDSGRVCIGGRDVSNLPVSKRNVGIVFQSYALFPNLTVAQNVAYGLASTSMPRGAVARRTQELLDLVGLPDLGKKYPPQLSGGQQQRVALARSMALSPDVLLLDEPLSALDAQVRIHLRSEIKKLQRELGVTTILVTHDQEEALTMSDTIVVMQHGRIQQQGDPAELYERPVNRFVANFIGVSNPIDGRLLEHDPTTGRGVVESDRGLRLAGVVTDPDARPTIGQHVIVAVRPERMRVEPAAHAEAPGEGWCGIDGRVHQGTYLGDQTEYRIETDQAGEIVARRQNASGAGASLGIGPGDPVAIRWEETANLILVA
jgi:iron(III) transport system ATP-binding protein